MTITPLTFHLILHTHWDREWYQTQAGFHPRLVAAFGDVIEMLERDPDARFTLDGQTVLAEDVLDSEPSWIERTVRAVTAEQLALGPWYVLADELVPSGESMLRNLLHGTRDGRALGARMDVLYSPDAFGHPAVLPTLAHEFGIEVGVVWRGLASSTGIDRDLYTWTGPDGSGLTIYHLPPQGYEIGADLDALGETLPARWRAIRPQLVARSTTAHVAIFVGADHHAPARSPGLLRQRISELEPGNEVRLSTPGAFFDAVAGLPHDGGAIAGELRSSYGHTWTLQGTFATRARLKRRHGAVELFMQRIAEPLAALVGWRGPDMLRGVLRQATRSLIRCQFHDTLCGCCSDDVAREQATRLSSIAATGREVMRLALHRLAEHDTDAARDGAATRPALLMWNPSARTRGEILTAEVTFFRRDVLVGPPSGRTARNGDGFAPFTLNTADDVAIPVQVLSVHRSHERLDALRHYPDQDEVDRVLLAFESPPAWGLGTIGLVPASGVASPPDRGLTVGPRRVANRFVEIHVDDAGRVALTDRRTGERYADILRIVAEDDAGDSYTPEIGPEPRQATAGPPVVIASGPLIGALELPFVVRLPGQAGITGRVALILHADSPIVRLRFAVNNSSTNTRLRFVAQVGIGDGVLAGAAFGHVRRVAANDSPTSAAECAVRTAPAQRYVAAGSGSRGLAVVAPGFFEYEWTNDRAIAVTLLRAIGELSRDTLAARPGHAGWPMPIPDAQEPGTHVIELGVVALSEGESGDPAELESFWEATFAAPQSLFVRDFTGDIAALETFGVQLEGRGLVFSVFKHAESGSGFIVRCHNTSPGIVRGRWVFRSPIAAATRCRGDESPVATLDVDQRHAVSFVAPAGGLVTILVLPESP